MADLTRRKNRWTSTPRAILETKVLQTVIGGETVYRGLH